MRIYENDRKEVKRRFQLWLKPSTLELADQCYESDNCMSRLLFKLAVELAVTMNVVAAGQGIDKATLNRLRGECVKEVKRLNGAFSFDDAVDWQNG